MHRLATSLILCSLIALNLLACSDDADLQAIREGIRNMSVAAEKRNTDGIMRYIDDSYHGVGGNRMGVEALLERHFSLNKNINLIISDIEITLAEDRQSAKVAVRVLMTGGEGTLPERGRLSAIRSQWQKLNGEWLVVDAKWKPVLLNI